MVFHKNRLLADASHVYHSLFVIFKKAAKFEIVACCKIIGGALWVKGCELQLFEIQLLEIHLLPLLKCQ